MAPVSDSVLAPVLVSAPPLTTPPSVKLPPAVSALIASKLLTAPDKPELMFSVSLEPAPPLSDVTPAKVTPEAMLSVSLPSPSAILPVTPAPALSVTTALPTPSEIAAPEVALTLDPDSRSIVTVPPALDSVAMPAPVPPDTIPETVTDSAPPELFAETPVVAPLIVELFKSENVIPFVPVSTSPPPVVVSTL